MVLYSTRTCKMVMVGTIKHSTVETVIIEHWCCVMWSKLTPIVRCMKKSKLFFFLSSHAKGLSHWFYFAVIFTGFLKEGILDYIAYYSIILVLILGLQAAIENCHWRKGIGRKT